MTAMNEFEPKKVMEAINELAAVVKTDGAKSADAASKSADALEKVAKIEKFLNEQEEKSQKIFLENARLEGELKSTQERLASLEKTASRPDFKGDRADTLKLEVKALEKVLFMGKPDLTADEQKGLTTLQDADGGYLVPEELDRSLIKNITEISPMRSVATVRTIRSKAVAFPKRTSIMTAYWTDEGQEGTKSNSKYGQEMIPLNRISARIETTGEALADSILDLESLVNQDAAEEMARLEGLAFVKGTGVLQPQGFSNSVTQGGARNSGVADDITVDSILLMAGDLKTGYNPTYAMNRTTMAQLRVKKAGDGHYLWVAGNIAAGVPNTINGYGYVEMPDMDDIAANAYPIAFADFRQSYMIVDRAGTVVIRDIYSQSNAHKVNLVFHKRVGGGLVKSESIKLLKCAA